MDQKAFGLIADRVEQALAEQGFAKTGGPAKDDDGYSVLYTGENVAYSVFYDEGKKRFELRTCAMTDEGPDKNWKNLSTWLFDTEENTMSEAEGIANDFVDTIQGPKRIAAIQQTKKKKKKDEESTNDPLFFFNRMVGIFPELKEEMNQERIVYGQVRPVTFAKAHLLPKMEALGEKYPDSEPFKRMCTLLNDMYQSGDMDVRSIITIVLLNGIQKPEVIESMKPLFSEDLSKSYAHAVKYKGKTVKPEKKKKPKKYTAETLDEMKRRR